MKTLLAAFLAATSFAQQSKTLTERAALAQAREDAAKVAAYHKNVAALKAAQARQKAFTDRWSKECAAIGKVLLMLPDGDPGCALAPAPPAATPPSN